MGLSVGNPGPAKDWRTVVQRAFGRVVPQSHGLVSQDSKGDAAAEEGILVFAFQSPMLGCFGLFWRTGRLLWLMRVPRHGLFASGDIVDRRLGDTTQCLYHWFALRLHGHRIEAFMGLQGTSSRLGRCAVG